MRKLIIFAVMLAVLASCNKETQAELASVSFNLFSGTKASVADVISQSISELGNINFEVTDANGVLHKISVGQTIDIPVGNTKVRGWHIPDTDCYFDNTRIATSPTIDIDTTLFVHSYTRNVVLDAHFFCALIIPDENVEAVRLRNVTKTEDLPVPFNSVGAFFLALRDDCELYVTAKENTDFTDRTVELKVGDIKDGHYYFLSPTGVTEGSSSFDYTLDELKEGGEI